MTKDDRLFDSADYRRSRAAYCCEQTFEYFILIIASDVYLAKLLTYIGISDALIGIISSATSLAFLMQLAAILLVRKAASYKKTVIFFHVLGCLMFASLYLIPFIPGSVTFKTVLVILCLILAFSGIYLVSSMLFKWANSYVHPHKRATFSAGKEMISLISGMVFTLAVGYAIDRCEALDRLSSAFLFLAAAGLILSICTLISLLLIRSDTKSEESAVLPMKHILKNTLKNRNFLRVILLTCLWEASRGVSIGFLGTFKTTDLMLSVGAVQVINIIANIVRVLVSKPFGRFSDRTSYVRGMELAFCIAALSFLSLFFTTKETWWFIIINTVLYNVSIAGTNQNSYNIVYSYVESDCIVQAMAIKNSIGGVFGFAASLLASRLLSAVQASGNIFMGFDIYGQQLLGLISFVLAASAIAFAHFILGKREDTAHS